MKFKLLDTVVLKHDLPDQRLQEGDLGAVVQTYEPDGLRVLVDRQDSVPGLAAIGCLV